VFYVENITIFTYYTLRVLVIYEAIRPDICLVDAKIADELKTKVAHHTYSSRRIRNHASNALIEAKAFLKRKSLEAASAVDSSNFAVQYSLA